MRRSGLVIMAVFALLTAACGGNSTEPTGAPSTGADAALEDSGAATAANGSAQGTTASPGATGQAPPVGYEVTSTGEVAFDHQGDVLCSLYLGELDVSLLQFDDMFVTYGVTLEGFDGPGDYAGTFALTDTEGTDALESSGPVSLTLDVAQGEVNPIIFGDFSGSFSGLAGNGSVEGSFACQVLESELAQGSGATSDTNMISYEVSGDTSASLSEVDVVFCSSMGSEIGVQTLGSGWGINVRALEDAAGVSVPADIMVAAPTQAEEVRDGDPMTDDRFYGSGTFTYDFTGASSSGMDVIEGSLTASSLQSAAGFTIDVKATFVCEFLGG